MTTTAPSILAGSRTFSSLYDIYHQNNNSVNNLTTNNDNNHSPSSSLTTTTTINQDTIASSNTARNNTNDGLPPVSTSAADNLWNSIGLSNEELQELSDRYVCDPEEFENGNEDGEGQVSRRTGQGCDDEDGRDGLSIE